MRGYSPKPTFNSLLRLNYPKQKSTLQQGHDSMLHFEIDGLISDLHVISMMLCCAPHLHEDPI